jgi:hypothetical protein
MKLTIEDGKSNVILAVELPATARRIAVGDSEAVVDGPAPLLDGLAELKRIIDGRNDEAWSRLEKARRTPQEDELRSEWAPHYEASIMLEKLMLYVESKPARSPASNAELCRDDQREELA